MIPFSNVDSAQTVFGTVNGNTAASTGTVVGAATYKSDWVDCSGTTGVCFDAAWSGGSASPAGTWSVEVSNLDVAPLSAVACGTAVTSPTSPTALTGNSGVIAIDVPTTSFRRARLVLTVSAGSFTLVATAFAKRVRT